MKNKIIKFLPVIIIILVVIFTFIILNYTSSKEIIGINNYDKNYYLENYLEDLDSSLEIFPDNKNNFINATFKSSLQTNLFDTDGYIILKTKYNKIDFDNEINRLKNISMTIKEKCYKDSKEHTNNIIYDEESYDYPAYITIDGFAYIYEYALINEKDLEITYVYLSYPTTNNDNYSKYLKKDKSKYNGNNENLKLYSMYNHTFDNNKTYVEFDDCNYN